ncbi:hypothetical protein Trydic_g952 [Trypoxylus dichotomus]
MKVELLLAALCVVVTADFVSYEGYTVYQLYPKHKEQVELIRNFSKDASFDFWSAPKLPRFPTTVMVARDAQEFFTQALHMNHIDYTILIENVESVIGAERNRQQAVPRLKQGRISFSEYHRYVVIQNYLSELAINYPDIVSLEEAGRSYEGLSISMIKIGSGKTNNPAILVDGGIHAREWISPAFALYLIQQLVENQGNRDMIENTNWLIIPVLNPDGYEFTHTTNRLWRKTRSRGILCHGADANRNFDFHWKEAGASGIHCSESYAGSSAFSESEAKAIKNVVNKYSDQIKLYITFHSYGNYLMYPWSYTSESAHNAVELNALAVSVEAAIASVSGTKYEIGSPPDILYEASGSSMDWVKGVADIALSYAFELPGGGIFGFDLPASKIEDVGIETFEGMKVFQNYTVYQLLPSTEEQLGYIGNFTNSKFLDFWSQPRVLGVPITVMVAPKVHNTFTSALKKAHIQHSLLIENVERSFEEERNRQKMRLRLSKGKISFSEYNRYEEIQDYLTELAAKYPDIATVEEIGSSYEGRPISMIKIGVGSSDNPTILVDGGIHAREWISPAFVTYLIHELVENESNRGLIENTDWLIIPVLNPDGYEYTHTDYRLWRKTRSAGSQCYGVDGNRNFDFHWMETGASSTECAETYAGPNAFSESETAALRNVVYEHADLIKLYLTFHSYGNFILYPWGYTSAYPEDVDVLDALATNVEAAIASVYGTRYTIGSSTNVLYAAAGGSDDWVKGIGGVGLSYTIELPGGGSWGFDLPPSSILRVCEETFEGVKVYQSYVENNFKQK